MIGEDCSKKRKKRKLTLSRSELWSEGCGGKEEEAAIDMKEGPYVLIGEGYVDASELQGNARELRE